MSVHVGTMTSEVVAEPEPGRAAGGEPMPDTERWRELDAFRTTATSLARLSRRTCAEGFDD